MAVGYEILAMSTTRLLRLIYPVLYPVADPSGAWGRPNEDGRRVTYFTCIPFFVEVGPPCHRPIVCLVKCSGLLLCCKRPSLTSPVVSSGSQQCFEASLAAWRKCSAQHSVVSSAPDQHAKRHVMLPPAECICLQASVPVIAHPMSDLACRVLC